MFRRFPKDGIVLYAELHDQGQELLEKEKKASALVPILGLLQSTNSEETDESYKNQIDNQTPQTERSNVKEQTRSTPGRLVVYGDSNCIDDSHLQKRTYGTSICVCVCVKIFHIRYYVYDIL